VIAFLKVLIKERQICVVCTVHQPSSVVFYNFDHALVLAKGQTAYLGRTNAMTKYLAEIGKCIPENVNPADVVIDFVSEGIVSKGDVDALLATWSEYQVSTTTEGDMSINPEPSSRRGIWTSYLQFMAVLRRNRVLLLREPFLYTMRAATMVIMMTFFGTVYIDSREQSQSMVFPRIFFMMWCSGVPASLTMIVVYAAHLELQTVKHEIWNGMYSPFTYVLAQLCTTVLMQIPLALCVMMPAYLLGNWPWDSFGPVIVLSASHLFCWECLGHLLSLFRNPVLGMLIYLLNWSVSLVFMGLFFNADDVAWPLRVWTFISPFRWFYNAFTHLVFKHATYDGARSCPAEPVLCPLGFVCDSAEGHACLGSDGNQILSSLHVQYHVISDTDEVALDCCVLLAIGVFFKLTHWVGVQRQCMLRPVANAVVLHV